MTSEVETKNKTIVIIINNKPHKTNESELTGKEIKELGGGPQNYLLVLVVKKPDPVAGGDDKIIADDESVELKSGMKFRIVNPGTFG